MRRPPRLLVLLLALGAAQAACAPENEAGSPSGAGGTATEAPGPAGLGGSPLRGSAVSRWAERLPEGLLRRAGACPFECCVYGTWSGTGPVPLRPRPERDARAIDTVPAGERFSADSGFVRLTGVALLAMLDTVLVEDGRYVPGDTLVLLDYTGEGVFNAWDGQRVRPVTGFWGAESDNPRAEMIGGEGYGREWWTHATRDTGARGWIDMDSVPRLEGADACG